MPPLLGLMALLLLAAPIYAGWADYRNAMAQGEVKAQKGKGKSIGKGRGYAQNSQ